MTTNQEGKHASFRLIGSTSGTYNEDSLAAFQAEGATSTNYNGAFIEWLQIRNSSSKTNLNDLQAEFAIANGFDSWSAVNLINASGGASAIASIQTVSITMSSVQTTNTATITAVDTSRTAIIYNGVLVAVNTSNNGVVSSIELTDSTTITVTRGITGSVAVTVNATIVEFESSAVDSVQSGSIILNAVTSNTDTITSVDTSRSVAIFTGQTSTTGSADRGTARIALTNGTTVTANKGDAGNSMTVFYNVIEFDASVIDSIQEVSITLTNGEVSDTAAITSVDTTRTSLLWQGHSFTVTGGADDDYPNIYLNSATEVKADRGVGTGTATLIVQVVVVEFIASFIESVQRGQDTIALSTSSTDITITSVDLDKSFVTLLNFKSTETSTSEDEYFTTIRFIDSTTIRIERGNSPSNATATASWEVIEWT